MAHKNSKNQCSHFLVLLSMLSICMFYIAVIMHGESVVIASVNISVSAVVITLWFLWINLIAFVYKLKMALNIMLSTFFCGLFFIALSVVLIHLPSPNHWKYQIDYHYIIDSLIVNYFKQFPLMLVLGLLNIKIVSDWLTAKTKTQFTLLVTLNVFFSMLAYLFIIERSMLQYPVIAVVILLFAPLLAFFSHFLQKHGNDISQNEGLTLVK
ncbi:MAG: hypothetical protein K0U23_02095 [Gammaproteobacteria bacterium]|nr:hypothetical protein [Gammaproteobacteria bacterium]